jgi:hypothetical protein
MQAATCRIDAAPPATATPYRQDEGSRTTVQPVGASPARAWPTAAPVAPDHPGSTVATSISRSRVPPGVYSMPGAAPKQRDYSPSRASSSNRRRTLSDGAAGRIGTRRA